MSANSRIIIVNKQDDSTASVTDRGLKGVLAVEILDASGDQITNFGGSATDPGTPVVYNIAMPTKNTEYSQALPANTKKVDIKLRALNALLKVAFTANESGTKYIQIPYGSSLHLENVDLTSITVYIQSPIANQTLEILCWT